MTLSPTERKIVVGLELEKANSIFSQIEVLQNAGFWDNIANRLYYSLFHAVSALLINEGLPVNSHKGAVLLFGQHFIKTQIFDKQYGKLYSQLQAMRERSDYNCYYDVSKEDLKRAYYYLAKLYHPDINPRTGNLFKEITEAYNVLKDPIKRREYD